MGESELIKQIIDGNKSAFGIIVKKYQGMITNTCYGFLMNKEDAEDVAQETFIEAYISINSFKQNSKISTWLYRIAVNKSIDFLRKKKRIKRFAQLTNVFSNDIEIEDYGSNNPQDVIESKERLAILDSAINMLSKNQNIALRLSKFEKLSGKEISEIMNLSLSSVESLIHRAKRNLKKILFYYYNGKM